VRALNERRNSNELQKEKIELKSRDLINLVKQATAILKSEKERGGYEKLTVRRGLVKIQDTSGQLVVIGDIHGDLETMLKIFEKEDIPAKLNEKRTYIVFLGDYIDRGELSLEVMTSVLRMKIAHPERVVILRGNHEGPDDLIAHPHTFPYELKMKFGSAAPIIYLHFRKLFNAMPHITLTSSGIVLLHGGVPTEAKNVDEIAMANELHPEKPHLTEILWNDPDETGITGAYPSPRGAGKIFGENYTDEFLKIVNGKVILRGHQAASKGYKVSHNGKIITLFSRLGPPYWNSKAAYVVHPLSRPPKEVVNSIRTIT